MTSLYNIVFGSLELATAASMSLVGRAGKAAWRGITKKKRKPVFGDADFAAYETLKKRGHFTPQGFMLGVLERKGMFGTEARRIYTHRESSVISIAPKRQGKTMGFVAHILDLERREKRPDLLVHDPAGDIQANTKDALERIGYKVLTIDLINPAAGVTYDPLSFVNPKNAFEFDRDMDAVPSLICADDAHTKDPHWVDFARILISISIAYNTKYNPVRKTLADCVDDILDDDKREEMLRVAFNCDDFIIRTGLAIFEKASKTKEGTSHLTTSLRKLRVWKMAAVEAVCTADSGRGWKFEDVFLSPQPHAIFVHTGLSNGGGDFVRLMFGNAINTARKLWDTHGKPLPKGLQVIVDEAVRVGNCNAVMDANNELSKAGVNVLLCFLSLQDMLNTYPSGKTLLSGCELVVYGGGKEYEWYELASKLCGERTAMSYSENTGKGGKGEGYHETATRVIKPDALRALPYEQQVIILNDLAVKCLKPFKRLDNGVKFI